MDGKDYILHKDGNYQCCPSPRIWNLLHDNYRFYRFLTDVEDVLNAVDDELIFLPKIQNLVRKLILNCYWIQTQFVEHDITTENSVLLLYDELGFPLTVQTVIFAPGSKSNIHTHGTWGMVAVLKGEEKHTFWRKNSTSEFADKIEYTDEVILQKGDIISLRSDSIHSVEVVGNTPTLTFNLYGETDPKKRWEFDIQNHTSRNF
ncbi:cupin [Anabaena sp. FACHB-1237]|uniref:cysteine dioxygenase family protein n=1 Tax=Anabaena sp. FACHB-1237 TaxID=2692769 RepID=UPI0016811E41|nr:cupin [Anabaena sp. FACHB-1237]MBD2137835.1 cupin [Anabaena sp. FACHB-1237]